MLLREPGSGTLTLQLKSKCRDKVMLPQPCMWSASEVSFKPEDMWLQSPSSQPVSYMASPEEDSESQSISGVQ